MVIWLLANSYASGFPICSTSKTENDPDGHAILEQNSMSILS